MQNFSRDSNLNEGFRSMREEERGVTYLISINAINTVLKYERYCINMNLVM